MKKRNKKYNPNKKTINRNAAFEAINLSRAIDDSKQERLEMGIRTSLEAFVDGVAEKCHFDTLASTVDLSAMMTRTLFEGAYSHNINLARDAMIRCKERFKRTGKLGLDGNGYQDLKFAIDIHLEQLKQVTGAELLKFLKKREQHIKSGNFYKSERVAA